MKGWLLSWIISDPNATDGSIECELGAEVAADGTCRVHRGAIGSRDLADTTLPVGGVIEDCEVGAYELAFTSVARGWRFLLRLLAEPDQEHEDRGAWYQAELAVELSSVGEAIVADAWELGMFPRNGAVFHSRLTGNDGDVITLASSSRGFRLRLKSMPVVFTIDCSGMTSEAQVWERYLGHAARLRWSFRLQPGRIQRCSGRRAGLAWTVSVAFRRLCESARSSRLRRARANRAGARRR